MCFKKLIFLCCGILLCALFSCRSKIVAKPELNYIPYYGVVYRADSLYNIGNNQACYELLDSLFKKYPVANMQEYYEYNVYLYAALRSGNTQNFAQKVEYAYRNFGSVVTNHKLGLERSFEIDKAAGVTKEQRKAWTDAYYDGLNKPLRAELLLMSEQDQAVRNGGDKKKWATVDSLNTIRIKQLFAQYGFLSAKMYGANTGTFIPDHDAVQLWALLVHLPDETKKELLPILLEHVKKGDCDPNMYALVYDKMLLIRDHPRQLYGAFDCPPCEWVQPDKVDSLRKSIGLPRRDYKKWRFQQIHAPD